MTVQSILQRKDSEVFTIRPSTTIHAATNLMRQRGVAALVATLGDTIVGIVSERDIIHAIAHFGEHALAMPVNDILPPKIITIGPTDSIKHAMSLMTRHRVRQLPVIVNGKLSGIVSIGDVVKHRLEDLETEANVLRDSYIAAR